MSVCKAEKIVVLPRADRSNAIVLTITGFNFRPYLARGRIGIEVMAVLQLNSMNLVSGPYWDRTSDLFDVNEALYR